MSGSDSRERRTPKLSQAAGEFLKKGLGGSAWEGFGDDSRPSSRTIDRRDTERTILEAALAREKELLADGWTPGRNFIARGMDITFDEDGAMQETSHLPKEEQLAVAIRELEGEGCQVEVIPGVNKDPINAYAEIDRRMRVTRETGFRTAGVPIPAFREGFLLCGDGEPQNGAFLYKKPVAH